MLEFLSNKVAGIQLSRPGTLLKTDFNTVVFSMNIAKFLRTTILRNICEWLLLYQSELFMFHYCNVTCFTVLKRHSICDAIFSLIFFYYIVILLGNNKKNILTSLFKLNPLCDKRTKHVKKSFDLFVLYLYTFFLVLDVLYERSCSTKGAIQESIFIDKCDDHK